MRQLKLGAFFYPTGHHVAAWRHSNAQADAGVNLGHCVEVARLAERGKFDLFFLADHLTAWPGGIEAQSRMARADYFEPITLVSAIAGLTTHIGLVATATTTYNEPFHIARKYASLDHISGGRAAWNLVTSSIENEAANFGFDSHPVHEKRYVRAREFARVVTGLWDSWDDDAFVRDKASGRYFKPEGLHVLNHKGSQFSVKGPLHLPRSPQGRPVIVQAGSSEDGKLLAAETAEVVFTAHLTRADAQAFYADVKNRAVHAGRSPDDLKLMPGLFPVVGRTTSEAEEKYEELQSLVHPDVGLALLATMLGGADLSGYPLDGPLPDLPANNNLKSRADVLVSAARRENLTIRQLYLRNAGGRGHFTIVGTPSQVADLMEDWFLNHAADGFNIMPPVLPGDLEDFVALVVPELQRRGLFRTEYTGRTLREHLGLRRPVNPISSAAISAVPA
jgi:FMN-dependent oxidoreductase (nitrilotriacetate monooxygenase family)